MVAVGSVLVALRVRCSLGRPVGHIVFELVADGYQPRIKRHMRSHAPASPARRGERLGPRPGWGMVADGDALGWVLGVRCLWYDRLL